MSLTIKTDEPDDSEKYVVQERLALTEDEQRLVPEEDAEARWLYAIPGQEIPIADAIRFGLVTVEKKKQATDKPKESSSPDEKRGFLGRKSKEQDGK